MESELRKTDYAELLLGIKGIGIVTLAACLGELGDPTRFDSPRALIVVSKKILTLIHTLAKKKESYDPDKVFGPS